MDASTSETVAIAKEAILGLLRYADFMGHQLSYELGYLNNDDLEEEAKQYFETRPVFTPEQLAQKAAVLRTLIGDRFGIDVLLTAFQCEYDEAERAMKILNAVQ